MILASFPVLSVFETAKSSGFEEYSVATLND
jgi:hypothetical protein